MSSCEGPFLISLYVLLYCTGAVNSNLIELTDEGFIHERKAHQRLMVGTLNNKSKPKTMADSLSLAGASVARGVRSGAMGIVQHPYENFAKEGAAGFVKGMGQAIVGAIVKPVIGVGDGAVLVMNHMSEEISIEKTVQKVPRRLRRALPRKYIGMPQSILLEPYDHRAAKAQLIITSNENSNDVYTSHVYLPEYLIIASEQRLWFVERKSRNQWSFIWEEISNFSVEGRSMKIKIFSQKGLKCHTFHGHSDDELEKLNQMLSMQKVKMVCFF
jgi:vacuolar protein sorting-associated protein 13A/C